MPRIWQSVKKTRDFKKITSSGVKYQSPAFLLFYSVSDLPHLGLIVSKKVGFAVKRNRAKRLLRVIFSELMPKTGTFIIIAKSTINDFSYQELQSFLKKIIKKLVPDI